MTECLWRVQPGTRVQSNDLVNAYTTRMHITRRFFGIKTPVTLSSQLTIAAGTVYIKDVNAYLQADDATLINTPEADGSNAYRAVITMVPGTVYVRGYNTYLQADDATFINTGTIEPTNWKNVTTWVAMYMSGLWEIPSTRVPNPHLNLWRRCASDRLQHENLYRPLNVRSAFHPRAIGELFFELSHDLDSEDIHIHLSAETTANVVVAHIISSATVKISATCESSLNQLIIASVYPCPITPVIKRYSLTTLTSDMSSATIQMEMNDKMMRATFNVEDKKLADFDEIIFTMPDYNDVQQTVFIGFIPSSSSTYSAADDQTQMTAYDYAWYLTMQYPSEADAALLSFDQQYEMKAWRLDYAFNSNPYLNFNEGDWIVGELSGHTGKVYSNTRKSAPGTGYLILTDVSGIPYYDINNHTCYFWWGDLGDGNGVHGENLWVNGTIIGANDGHTVETVFEFGDDEAILYPHVWVKRLLGGDNWQRVTGIYPYRLTSVGNWASLGKSFAFDEKTTKIKAIEEVCKYLDYLFFVKWKNIAGSVRPCAYFIPFYNIDHATQGLDLPALVSFIKSTDKYVVEPIERDVKGEEKYNKVTVKCIGWDSKWYTTVKQTDACAGGLELPIEYFEICDFADDQVSCDARATALFYYYQNPIQKWIVTILDHPALELYQTVAFYGFTDQITTVVMRIVGISKTISDGGTVNETKITVIPDSQFKSYLSISRIFTGTISETEAIANAVADERGAIDTGIVVAINPDGTVVVKNDRGLTVLARDAS